MSSCDELNITEKKKEEQKWSIPHQKKERCKDWLGEKKKKIFSFGITTVGARGSLAPRDLTSPVKLTKLVWKDEKNQDLNLFYLPSLNYSSP